jgi:hypothetical protein
VPGPNRVTRWRRTLESAGLFSSSDPDHDRLSRRTRDAALRRPQDSTGFPVVARKRA